MKQMKIQDINKCTSNYITRDCDCEPIQLLQLEPCSIGVVASLVSKVPTFIKTLKEILCCS